MDSETGNGGRVFQGPRPGGPCSSQPLPLSSQVAPSPTDGQPSRPQGSNRQILQCFRPRWLTLAAEQEGQRIFFWSYEGRALWFISFPSRGSCPSPSLGQTLIRIARIVRGLYTAGPPKIFITEVCHSIVLLLSISDRYQRRRWTRLE